ncbi:MAG TPA: hypothetical protein VLH19_01735 [Patescibacteria group bacterium]|nr:hypothetical protein [Patescibacteria group bacterium]
MLSWSTYFMCEELKKRGYSTISFDNQFIVHVSKNDKHFYIHAGNGPREQMATYMLCRNKYTMKQVVTKFGFPTSKFMKITPKTTDDVSQLQFPLVLKPLDRFGGTGVVVGIISLEDVRKYFEKHPTYEEALAEEMLEGEDTRILIVRGKFFAGAKRIPAFVNGDGAHTIQELVWIENERRAKIKADDEKNQTYTTDLDLILFDDDSLSLLQETGLSAQSIPKVGQRVFVRKNANTSTGGISIDVTDQVGPEIRSQCEQLAEVLDMGLAGIDVMTKDLSKPLNIEERSGIIEVNSSPGLDLHILTDEGQRHNPVPLIVDEIEEYLAKEDK